MKAILLNVLILVAVVGTSLGQAAPEPAFANQDVTKLVKLKLSDDVVIAKVKQAAVIEFDLSTDGLIQLKQAGVSDRVIGAMLERTTAKPAPAVVDGSSMSMGGGSQEPDRNGQDVRIMIRNQEVRLPSSQGDISVTGMWPVVFTFLDYPGLHARVRTTDDRPTLLVRSAHDPTNYYYLGKLDANEDDNNRSLKIEQKGRAFTATTRVVPAGNWIVEYSATEASPGVWKVVPNESLQPGEYGIVIPGGILYEFGRD